VQVPTRKIATAGLIRLVAGVGILLAVLLWAAGTVAYWEAWLYVGVLFLAIALVFVYLLANDPELLERRLRTREQRRRQGLIVRLAAICFALTFVLPGLDRRFGWSHVPAAVVIAADAVVLLGYGLFVLALRENSYASRVVEVETAQQVVTTGPYALVRHPMYLAVLAMTLASPVALGSWWAVIPASAMVAILVARIKDEEQLLVKELGGYRAYMQTTRDRLIPGVW
jgi:protein-S-isoprenylcysteine O-methyltransferase Ste14